MTTQLPITTERTLSGRPQTSDLSGKLEDMHQRHRGGLCEHSRKEGFGPKEQLRARVGQELGWLFVEMVRGTIMKGFFFSWTLRQGPSLPVRVPLPPPPPPPSWRFGGLTIRWLDARLSSPDRLLGFAISHSSSCSSSSFGRRLPGALTTMAKKKKVSFHWY
jgi:hypothetical protein